MSNKSKKIREYTGMSRAAFSRRYNIPLRTLENWDSEVTEAPEYVMDLLEKVVDSDTKSRKRYSIIEMPREELMKEIESAEKKACDYQYDHAYTSADKYEIGMIIYREGYTDKNACIEIYTVDDDGKFFKASDYDDISNFLNRISTI